MTRIATGTDHVLFLDIVGYSHETTNVQGRLIGEFGQALSESPSFAAAAASGGARAHPLGEGMALYFRDAATAAQCASELRAALHRGPLKARIGLHTSPLTPSPDGAGGIAEAARVLIEIADAGEIVMSEGYADALSALGGFADRIGEAREGVTREGVRLRIRSLATRTGTEEGDSVCVVLVYKRNAQPDEAILTTIRSRLEARGHGVFFDRHLKIGVEWAKAIEKRIRLADWVIAIASDSALESEMIEQELEIATDERRRRGRPLILPVRVGGNRPAIGPAGAILNPLNFAVWNGPTDEARVIGEILDTIEKPSAEPETVALEPVGGAVPIDSPFYIERQADEELAQALDRHESIVLVKGPRQMGKTSLIGRGIGFVDAKGWRMASTDFQKLSATQLASEELFFRVVAHTLARSLNFKYDFEEEWLDVFGANMNFDNFIRALIEDSKEPLVWFMDEADKLFAAPFATDFFGLVRSWHNSRVIEPNGPWSRFTAVIGYATEAHLFIQDLNQSPFNVGRQLRLEDFVPAQVRELSRRYGSPLKSMGEFESLMNLVGGQPFLLRRALDVLARGAMDLPTLIASADRDDGPFGDHLKRVLMSVSQLPEVMDALRASARQPDLRDAPGFSRLLSAGIVKQRDDGGTELRYELYRRYLLTHLGG